MEPALYSGGIKLAGLIFESYLRTSFHFVSFSTFSFKDEEKAKMKG